MEYLLPFCHFFARTLLAAPRIILLLSTSNSNPTKSDITSHLLVLVRLKYFHLFKFDFISLSLNYIKQLGLKDNLRLKRGFSMETLCRHEYDIPLVRGGHLEGPNVFGFLIHVFPSEIWTQA